MSLPYWMLYNMVNISLAIQIILKNFCLILTQLVPTGYLVEPLRKARRNISLLLSFGSSSSLSMPVPLILVLSCILC